MSACTIRPIHPADLAQVLEVYRQCEDFLALGPQAKASPEMVEEDIAHSREEGGEFCGIFAADGRMVGVVDYVPRNFEGQPQAAFLSLLMIAAPHRSTGVGRAAAAWVESQVRQQSGVKCILSAVQVNNPQALRFWQSCGYRVISAPQLQPDGTTTLRLRKDLPGS